MRSISRGLAVAVVLLVAAVSTSVAATGRASGPTSSATTKGPSGRAVTLTVRKGHGGGGGWCAKVEAGGEGALSGEHCGSGAARGLHGAYVADCGTHELIAYGAVRPSVSVMQPRRGRRPRFAAHAPRPDGVRFAGDHYVIVVDLRQADPRLVARRDGKTLTRVDFASEARHCDGLGLIGVF